MEEKWCCAIVCVDDHCHFSTKVTCICVQNLLINCGFVAKIDNKLIMILIGKVLFNKFIGHLFSLMHV